MANGFQTALLDTAPMVFKNDPALQLPYLGMLDAVLSTTDGTARLDPLNARYDLGHQRAMTVAYDTRISPTQTSTTALGCSTGITPVYNEFTVPNLQRREIGIWLPDSLLRQYKTDASRLVTLPKRDFGPGTQGAATPTYAMNELWRKILNACGAVARAINQDIVADMLTQFGTNVTTGNANAKALSFSLGTANMADAFIQLIEDVRRNQMDASNLMIVGSGPLATFDLIKDIMSNGASAQGINMQALASKVPKVFYDSNTAATWGANQVALLEKGSVHFLTRNMNIGSFARRVGPSEFFTIAVPAAEYTNAPQNLDKLLFDVQLKEMDCPVEGMTLDGVEDSATDGPGILAIISKQFKLFTKPSLYAAGDPLVGTNGTLRYTVTAS